MLVNVAAEQQQATQKVMTATNCVCQVWQDVLNGNIQVIIVSKYERIDNV